MADEPNEVLANLIAITSLDDAAALQLLEATNWNLEESVQLWSSGVFAGAGTGPLPTEAGVSGSGPLEDEVRAPLPTKVDRLYGDVHDGRRFPAHASNQGTDPMSAYGRAPPRRPVAPVDVFRDSNADVAGSSSSVKASTLGPSLSDMFKPPTEIMFPGDTRAAIAQAVEQGRWLMLNVQSPSEFASHQLNRDTWSHEAVKEAVKGMFVFVQLQEASQEGQQAVSSYKIKQLPTIMVLDPMSGAKLYERSGFVDAQLLLEELVVFMENGPQDPGAGQLAQQRMMRMGNGQTMQRPSVQTSTTTSKPQGGKPLTEDEELAMAIAMSMEQGKGSMSEDDGDNNDDDDDDGDLGYAENGGGGDGKTSTSTGNGGNGGNGNQDKRTPGTSTGIISSSQAAPQAPLTWPACRLPPEQAAVAQQSAASHLPAEPNMNDPSGCRVALRLPDGQRKMRRFKSTDPLQVLYDFALSCDVDAAAGRPFSLAPQPVQGGDAQQLTDKTQSLEAAKVNNALVMMQYTT